MYKNAFFGLVLIWLSACCIKLQAQTKYNRWAVGVGASMLHYLAKSKGPELQYSFYDPAVQVSGTRYLSAAFDFHTAFTYSPKVHFPLSVERNNPTQLFDMNYQLRFKVNNGLFMREDARIGPYLAFGIGGSYTQDRPDVYVPLGGGIRFRLGERTHINAEAIRKFSLNKDFQHVAYGIAFVYNLGKEEVPYSPAVPDELSSDEAIADMLPEDNDGDGIINIRDRCPNEPGLAMYLGCPAPLEKSKEEVMETENEAIMTTVASSEVPAKDTLVQAVAERPSRPSIEDVQIKLEQTPIKVAQTSQEEVSLVKISPCGQEALDLLPPVFFTNGSDQLSTSAKSALNKIAEMLNACADMRLVVQGHADATGEEERNLLLSVMRAYHVKYYLVYEQGISQMRISSAGKGEQNPIASNTTHHGREQNRRVDFRLSF